MGHDPLTNLLRFHLANISLEAHRTLHLHDLHRLLGRHHLFKHILAIEERFQTRDPEFVVKLGDGDTLNVQDLAVGFDGHRVAVLVLAHIVALHVSPVPPLARHRRRPAVHLEDLEGKVGHHCAEGVVALFELGVLRAVVLVG